MKSDVQRWKPTLNNKICVFFKKCTINSIKFIWDTSVRPLKRETIIKCKIFFIVQKPLLTARSATQLKVGDSEKVLAESEDILISCRVGSCTDLQGVGAGYSSMAPSNTARFVFYSYP